jgi:hypothetical protein
MYRYWELNGKPKNFNEGVNKGMFAIGNYVEKYPYHASSVAYNKDNDTYEIMKSKNHPTLDLEFDDYLNNTEFNKEYVYDKDSHSYIRRSKNEPHVVLNEVVITPKPAGLRRNNLTNIRKTHINWDGEVEYNPEEDYEQFESPEHSIRATRKILNNYVNNGYNTIDKIINRWAPSVENPTKNYVNFISNKMKISPNEVLNLKDENTLFNLTNNMVYFENGEYVDPKIIKKGLSM